MKVIITIFFLGLSSMVCLAFLIGWLANIPVVYESWSTGKCIKVEFQSKEYSCRMIPTGRYFHEWVE